MYKMPAFKPIAALPPSLKLDSALILHIGHCAAKSAEQAKQINMSAHKMTLFAMTLKLERFRTMKIHYKENAKRPFE